MTAFTEALQFTIPAEGGYQRNPSDGGNWTGGRPYSGVCIGTNMGVSAALLSKWLERTATVADMKAVDADTQQAIAAVEFWNPILGDQLPLGVSLMTFDMQYNAGINGGKCLQRALGFSGKMVDGWIGDKTLTAIQTVTASNILSKVSSSAVKSIQSLLGLVVDGDFGNISKNAVAGLSANRQQAIAICASSYDQHVLFYKSDRAGFAEFGAGWLHRASDRLSAGLKQTLEIN